MSESGEFEMSTDIQDRLERRAQERRDRVGCEGGPGVRDDPSRSNRDHAPELPQVPADGIDPRRARSEIPLPQPMQGPQGLLLHGLHGHRIEGDVPHGFEQGLRVRAIGLVAVAIAGHVSRMQQGDLVAEALERAGPVMRGAARLEHHLGRRAIDEIAWQPGARDAAALVHLTGHRGDGELEDGLCQVNPRSA